MQVSYRRFINMCVIPVVQNWYMWIEFLKLAAFTLNDGCARAITLSVHFLLQVKHIALILCWLLTLSVTGQDNVVVNEHLSNRSLSEEVYYHCDSTNTQTLQEVQALPEQRWKQWGRGHVYLFPNRNQHWFKATLKNESNAPAHFVVELNSPVLYDVELYEEGEERETKRVGGTRYTFPQREMKSRIPAFDLHFDPGEQKQIYIRVHSNGNYISFPFMLWNQREYPQEMAKERFTLSLYYGALLLILVINIYLFITVRSKLFFFYLLYALSLSLMQLARDGFAGEWFYPNAEVDGSVIAQTLILLLIAFNLQFFQLYLDTKKLAPRYHVFINIIKWTSVLLLPTVYLPFTVDLVFLHLQKFVLVANVAVVLGSILLLRKNHPNALFYLAGFGVLFIGGLITIFCTRGVIESKFLENYGLKIASFIEIIIFTAAMVDFIVRRQRAAQQLALQRLYDINQMQVVEKEREREEASLREKLLLIELQALRSQMNPHFIFNALNSIQSYIATNKNELAERYMARFAAVVRKFLDHSKSKTITLESEIQMLEEYMELEKMRFKEKVNFTITYDKEIQPSELELIPTLIQPFLENAVIHGIGPLKGGGRIKVHFSMIDDYTISCAVEDNGVGREGAQNNQRTSTHKSHGTSIIRERLEALAQKENRHYGYEVIDLYEDGNPIGTKVNLQLPIY